MKKPLDIGRLSLLLLFTSSYLFAQKPLAELQLVSIHPKPVIGKGFKGTEDNQFGFEGGTCVKVEGVYYLFTTEIFDVPKTAATRLALWTSQNGLDFKRQLTLVETNRNWDDTTTHRMSPWSPMVVYDTDREVWSVFHVGYRRKPNSTNVFNMSGKIFRYDSQVKGKKGIIGPYKEGGSVEMEGKPDWWEGPGQILSFYPYRIGKEWWAIYGSNNVPLHVNSDGTGGDPNVANVFYGGLAKAKGGLTGTWERKPELNPLKINEVFIENSVVTKVAPNLYINLYDGGKKDEIGYSCSRDGIHWGKEQLIKLKNPPAWIKYPRTPLCLIDEGKGIYTIYSTAFDGINPENVEPLWHQGFGSVGRIRVRLKVI